MPTPWDVRFGSLVRGRFQARLSRFHASVEAKGRRALAHMPNSGRLRELLVPGNEVLLAPASGQRRTAFDLVMARIPEDEQGPGGGVWASLDARLPPRILAGAVARAAIPELAGCRVLRTEPPLGQGRADLLLDGPGGEVLVEAKSITLVRAGAGLFPDSPTLRGTGHVRALVRDRGRRRVLAFLVQRPDAASVRANEPADPAFASALRDARAARVEVICGTCDVSPEGIRWRGSVPFEWFRPHLPVDTLPDHLRGGLRLLVCGMNPGRYAAFYGMYYARPGNLFWPAVRASGLVPRTAGPGDEPWLARTQGIGFTDVVKRPTRGIHELGREDWAEGAARVCEVLRRYRPEAVVFVGLAGARAVLGEGAGPGRQPHPIEGVPVFAVPATSGRQASYSRREVFRWFRALAAWLRPVAIPDGRGDGPA